MGAKLQGVLTPSRNQRELMEEGGGDVLTALFKAGGADLLLYFFFSHQGGVYKRKGTTGLSRRRGQQERAHLSESDKSVYDPLIMKKFV